jgi:hypothetical protein
VTWAEPSDMERSWHEQPTPTDKVTAHSYLRVYDKLLAHLRGEPLRIVEVGVLKGGSLALWHRFFPQAAVTGLDINQDVPEVEGCDVRWGDSRDAALVGAWFLKDSIDVLIDDGDHTLDAQRATFFAFRRAMRRGGIYFIEDVYPFENVAPLVAMAGIRKTEVFDLRKLKGRIDDVLIAVHF